VLFFFAAAFFGMCMSEINKVEKLKMQREQLNARIQKMEASEKAREKKRDTRRKILIGAYYLDKARDESTMDEVNKIMDGFLTRQSDRELFGLKTEEA